MSANMPAASAAETRFLDVGQNAIELARSLIRVDTSNPPGNETVAATVLKNWLASHGVESELIGPDPARQNLVATVKGRGEGPSIALCGHLDVVPVGELSAWKHPPFAAVLDDEGFVWGRGAVDMKAQVATRAAALVALVQSGVEPLGDVRLIVQSDEEVNAANVGMSWLVNNRPDLRTDWALEEGGGRHMVLPDGRAGVLYGVADKTSLHLELHAYGEGGHASSPGDVRNPVITIARLLERLERADHKRSLVAPAEYMLRELLNERGVIDDVDTLVSRAQKALPELASSIDAITRNTYTATMLRGSQAVNVVPDHAICGIDCRVLPGHDVQSAISQLEDILHGSDGDSGGSWRLIMPERSSVGGSSSEPVVEFTDACARALERIDGRPITMVPIMNPFYTDASHLRQVWGTTTYGLWPWKHTPPVDYQSGVHAPNERIKAQDIAYAAQWHLELLLDLASN